MKRLILVIALASAGFTARAQIASEGQSILIRPEQNLTVAEAGWRSRSEDDALLPAEGRGLSQGEFRAVAAHSLDSLRRVEGRVSYERGVKRGVCWNTSSDWELLAPYVTVDSVGGDLQKEQYRFYARYASHAGKRLTYSLFTDYRALHEYRQVDPRPRNITADLLLGASGGVLAGDYAFTLEGAWRVYHQSGDVSFSNPLGMNTAIIHDLGFGRSFTRFSGSSSSMNARFRGGGLTASLTMEPLGHIGWIAGADYSYTDIVRHLKAQNETPLSELRLHRLEGYAGHKWQAALVRARAAASLKRGLENVVDQTSAFGTAATLPLYRQHAIEASLDAIVERPLWTVHPSLGFSGISASDLYPGSSFRASFAKAGADVSLRLGKTLSISAGAEGRLVFADDFLLASAPDERTTAYLEHLAQRVSDSRIGGYLSAEASFATRDRMRLFVRPLVGGTYYFTDHYRLDIQIFTGIQF